MLVKFTNSLFFLIFAGCLLLSGFNESFGQKRKTPRKTKSVVISCGVCNQKAISLPKPEYPKAATAVRASGEVGVQILIDEKGAVIEAKAVSGHPLLRASSVKAAFQAKFEPLLLSGKPVRVNGTIVYNFSLDSSDKTVLENKYIETVPLGVLNDKALKIWFLKNQEEISRPNETIQVQVTINLQEGKVILAKAISAFGSTAKLAELSALQAIFKPILSEFPTIYGTGILIFTTEDLTGKLVENKNPKPILPIMEFRTAIINGKAIKLEKPEYSEEARNNCAAGKVEVLTLIHSASGEVFAAKAISGNELLFEASEKAVLKSKFAPSNINGDNNFYLLSKIVYNFDPFAKCISAGVVNKRALNIPKPIVNATPKKEFTVTVQIVVDESGDVVFAKALSGHPLIRAACEKSARHTKFAPSMINGPPFKVKAFLTYKFKPDGTIEF